MGAGVRLRFLRIPLEPPDGRAWTFVARFKQALAAPLPLRRPCSPPHLVTPRGGRRESGLKRPARARAAENAPALARPAAGPLELPVDRVDVGLLVQEDPGTVVPDELLQPEVRGL